MKKVFISLFLIPILLFGPSIGAHAYAGSADDPLISQSYVHTWAEALLNDLVEQARSLMQSFEDRLNADNETVATPQKKYTLAEGATIRLYEGASITVTSGTAKVSIIKGDFVNATVGGAAINGRTLPGHLYIVCEGGEALVTATAAASFNIEGRFTVTNADGTTPTATPAPSVTPSPTPTTTPTPTPTASPTPTPEATPADSPIVTSVPPVTPTPVVTPTPIVIVIEPTPVIVYVTVTPAPTAVPKPSASPEAPATAAPTATPEPSAEVTPTPIPASSTITFKDVSAQAWFYNDLRACVRMGLLNGISKKEFDPSGDLTMAQAITLAARMHQLQYAEEITLKNHWFGRKWYKTYVNYAVENELIDESFKKLSRKEMNAPITRGELIELLYKVLPEDRLKEINDIEINEIPDVKDFSDGAEAIYAMYRAGIITGYTDTPGVTDHTFKGHEIVSRSEAAVIAARMMETTRRVEFTIEKE